MRIYVEKKLVDPNKLCMGCMEEVQWRGMPCPKCGFDLRKYQRPENALPIYEILNGKYLLGRVLGIGGFGITYIAWDFYQAKRVCVKEYFPREIAIRNHHGHSHSEQLSVSLCCNSDSYTQHIDKIQSAYMQGLEAYIKEAENLSHYYLMPGIVSIRDFFYGNATAYIVMEYIDGIDMKKYTMLRGGKLRPEEAFLLLKPVLKALQEVHFDNIIHRDISPDNIMLTRKNMHAILIDFGAARTYGNSENAPVFLKHGYAPVEQYQKDGNQGPWTDIYSICATMYFLMTGVKIPPSIKRRENDTLLSLGQMGVPLLPHQDEAIWQGLSIEAEQRYQSIGELFWDIYRE